MTLGWIAATLGFFLALLFSWTNGMLMGERDVTQRELIITRLERDTAMNAKFKCEWRRGK